MHKRRLLQFHALEAYQQVLAQLVLSYQHTRCQLISVSGSCNAICCIFCNALHILFPTKTTISEEYQMRPMMRHNTQLVTQLFDEFENFTVQRPAEGSVWTVQAQREG